MGAYSYEVFIKEFAERTRKNYSKILHRYEEDESQRYEVTQLINSLFGLLIVPNEKYKYKKNGQGKKEYYLKRTEAYTAIADMICDVREDKRFYSSYDDKYEVSDFIRHMRNSLAHSGNQGLHFLPCEEGKEITSVIFYDNNEEVGEIREFCVELTVSEISDLAVEIANMYSEIESYEDADEKRKLYVEEISKCRKLFERNGK